ncbi:MAG: hypothetical protein AABZ60_23575 [Planctomycetota bacterium]
MKKKSKTSEDIEKIAEKAQKGEDVSQYFAGIPIAKQRVNVDFSLQLLKQIDIECRLLGITRQSWIKMACDNQLREVQISRRSLVSS